MAEIFELPDFAAECEPLEFTVKNDSTVYRLRPFALLNAEDVARIGEAEASSNLVAVADLIADNDETAAFLKKMPLAAYKPLLLAWRERADINQGE